MTNLTADLSSRAVLALGGDERTTFLQGLVTNDVTKLGQNAPLYAGLLTPQGKLLYDFLLFAQDDAILIDVAREDADALAKRLTMYKLRAKVSIARREDLHVQASWGDAPLPGLPDPRHPMLGTRQIVTTPASVNASEADYLAHRYALGIAEGNEITHEATYPLEANFEALHGVDFKKGCYVGQELTARMKFKTQLRKRVLPVEIWGLTAPGDAISDGAQEIGTLLGVEGRRGLALVRLDRLEAAGDAPLKSGEATLKTLWPDWIPK